MGSEMELNQAIYVFLLTQIKFGVYPYESSLPTMEETGRQLHVSIDTVKPAYHRLQREGYISLSKKAGAKVTAPYTQAQIERHIQSFFALRKDALFDLCQSIWPLFGWAQWLGLKHASAETMDSVNQIADETVKVPYGIWPYFEQLYGPLGNELLIRLTRYIYLFFQGPFYCVMKSRRGLTNALHHVQRISALCHQENWEALPNVLLAIQEEYAGALRQFYQDAIPPQPADEQMIFCWDAYKKSSQRRYTLSMDLLIDISRGVYPVGSYLPSAERLSLEKGVSISTVRRAVSLLNSIGAVKSSRPLGARVLPPAQSTENCDFTQPDLRRRLLDLTSSLQMFALSCRSISKLTLASLTPASIRHWISHLCKIRSMGRYELVTYASLELLSKYAPYQTIRTVYTELLRLLFWGNPLRGMRGVPDVTNAMYGPYFSCMIASLKEKQIDRFSAKLEELLLFELRVTVDQLLQVGIPEAGTILVPSKNEHWTYVSP